MGLLGILNSLIGPDKNGNYCIKCAMNKSHRKIYEFFVEREETEETLRIKQKYNTKWNKTHIIIPDDVL